MSTESDTTDDKSPGEMLQEARKTLGLNLADVAAMTRIPKAMLRHLESDRYDEYAAEVFARGHLRNYAREVQLDPDIVLQAFDRYTGTFESTPELDQSDERSAGEATADSDASQRLSPETWFEWEIEDVREKVRPAHLVAVGLVVVGLFVLFGVFTEEKATAQKTYQYDETSGAATDSVPSQEASEKSRWLLDRNDESQQESERDE